MATEGATAPLRRGVATLWGRGALCPCDGDDALYAIGCDREKLLFVFAPWVDSGYQAYARIHSVYDSDVVC